MKFSELKIKERLKVLIISKYLTEATFVNINGNLFLNFCYVFGDININKETLYGSETDKPFVLGTHPLKEESLSYTVKDLLESTLSETFIYINGETILPFKETVTALIKELIDLEARDERT